MSVLGSYEFSNVSHIAISSLVGKVKTKFSHYTQPTLCVRENGLRCLSSKESSCPAGEAGNDPWVGKTPWKRKWQPTPLFLPGKSHGQRSLVGYSTGVGYKRVGYNLVAEQKQKEYLKLRYPRQSSNKN